MQVDLREKVDLPPGLSSYRYKGADRYNNTGLPGNKTEHWMKIDLTGLKEKVYNPAEPGRENPFRGEYSLYRDICERIDVVNGFVQPPANLSYDLVKGSGEPGRAGDETGQYFYNLNSALAVEPLFITVKKGGKRKPLHLAQFAGGGEKTLIASPRIIVVVEEGAELELIQSFSGKEGTEDFLNSVTEIILEKNSKVKHLILQQGTGDGKVFNNLFVIQNEGSAYDSLSLITGGKLTRHEYDISLKGKNCTSTNSSLFLGKGEMVHNSDITIRHKAPNCTSRTAARAIAGGDAQGVFRGFAVISPGAQKSDAQQQLKTILLSDRAQVNMEPHLEIWADDVKCSHGATVGQLDREQLFYLQTRGFSPEDARKMLLTAFAGTMTSSLDLGEAGQIAEKEIFELLEGLYE